MNINRTLMSPGRFRCEVTWIKTDLHDPRELGRLRPEKRGAHAAVQAVESDDEARARGVPIREVHLVFFFFSFVFFFLFLVIIFSFVFSPSSLWLWSLISFAHLPQPIECPAPMHFDPCAFRTGDEVPLERLPLFRAPSQFLFSPFPSPSPSPSAPPSALPPPSAPACAGRCVCARGTAGWAVSGRIRVRVALRARARAPSLYASPGRGKGQSRG